MAVWIDVTTSLSWERPPVGIVRTELECVRHVLTRSPSSAGNLCYFDKAGGVFRSVSKQQRRKIDDLLRGRYGGGADSSYGAHVTIRPASKVQALSRIRALLRPRVRSCLDHMQGQLIRGWAYQPGPFSKTLKVLFELNGKVIAETGADKFREDLLASKIGSGRSGFEMSLSEILSDVDDEKDGCINVLVKDGGGRNHKIGEIEYGREIFDLLSVTPTEEGEIVRLECDDIYITAGLDWDTKDFSRIYQLKKEQGFRLLGFCYDMIPFYMPHLCVGDVSSFFAKHFTELTWCSNGIVCISEQSKRDYLNFTDLAGIPVPPLKVVRLGSSVSLSNTDEVVVGGEIKKILGSEYILYVSTIERRKNHETLYKAYVRLIESGRTNLPKLVFVGMRGWGVDDILNDIKLDPRIRDYIIILSKVNDKELEILYEGCRFTVFPSLYEGWGLPVSESLRHGKYCITSNCASIAEIAPSILEGLDPWDVNAWAESIYALSNDPERLHRKEDDIRRHFVADTWTDCVDDILAFARRFHE